MKNIIESCQADTKFNPIALAEARTAMKQCIEKYPNAIETGLAASCFDFTYGRAMERIARNQPQ